MDASAVIIGGGPSGAAAGRLLASWGHRVLLLHKPGDRLRGLAESLPPSTSKLLQEIGILDLVHNAGFYRSTGNTAWWGSGDPRVEAFESPHFEGLQVFRPEFDRLLLQSAEAAGADVRTAAAVRVAETEGGGATVDFIEHDERRSASCRFVLDCSGRSGVIGRRYRVPDHRMYALVGAWHLSRAQAGWGLPDPTHTVVEAYDNGWVWSVPTSGRARHVGIMVDGISPRTSRGQLLAGAYLSEVARTRAHAPLVKHAELQRVWACDASTYSAETYTGAHFLLVGDAGSFIDPLSSFGVKKALGSGWIAALVVNTCLEHPGRLDVALDFFSGWEKDMYETHARRSAGFARQASAQYPSPFWAVRAEARAPDPGPDASFRAALEMIRQSTELDVRMADGARLEKHAAIRGREIVLEEAFADRTRQGRGIRFWENVDLIRLAEMACHHRQVPELFEAYCRTNGPVPLPSVLGGLSLLVAKGILSQRNVRSC